MVENFGQYTPGAEELGGLEVAGCCFSLGACSGADQSPGKTLGYLAAR